jgi:hypothetical protein
LLESVTQAARSVHEQRDERATHSEPLSLVCKKDWRRIAFKD